MTKSRLNLRRFSSGAWEVPVQTIAALTPALDCGEAILGKLVEYVSAYLGKYVSAGSANLESVQQTGKRLRGSSDCRVRHGGWGMNDSLEVLKQLIPNLPQARQAELFGEALQEASRQLTAMTPEIGRLEQWQHSVGLLGEYWAGDEEREVLEALHKLESTGGEIEAAQTASNWCA